MKLGVRQEVREDGYAGSEGEVYRAPEERQDEKGWEVGGGGEGQDVNGHGRKVAELKILLTLCRQKFDNINNC